VIEAERGELGEPFQGIPIVASAPPRPVEPDWLNQPAAFQFRRLEVRDSYGVTYFLDVANLERRGDRVSGVSLTVLGPRAQRTSAHWYSTTALNRIQVDCAARTLTVLALVGWNRHGDLEDVYATPGPARTAGESPNTAAQIDAACTGAGLTGSGFADREGAFTSVAAGWSPPAPPPWKPECLWRALPEADREAFLEVWDPASPFGARLKPAADSVFDSCGVPAGDRMRAANKLRLYANTRAALTVISQERPVDEAQLRAEGATLDFRTRQRLAGMASLSSGDDDKFAASVDTKVAGRLGLYKDQSRWAVRRYLINALALTERE